MTEHWYTFPREIVEPPFLEIFKSHLTMVLSKQFWETQLEHRG